MKYKHRQLGSLKSNIASQRPNAHEVGRYRAVTDKKENYTEAKNALLVAQFGTAQKVVCLYLLEFQEIDKVLLSERC